MCVIWAVVAVIAAYMLNDNYDPNTVVSLIISAVFMSIAVVAYLGHYQFITGLSTMSLEELNQYDLEAITYYTGICMFATSITSFTVYVVATFKTDYSTALMYAATTAVAILIIWAAWMTFSSRFKNKR